MSDAFDKWWAAHVVEANASADDLARAAFHAGFDHAIRSKRRRMPAERAGFTQKLCIGNELKVYATVSLFPDGRPGELFLVAKKTGSLVRGLCHILAIIISVALQYGVPLESIIKKLKDVSFEPAGFTGNPDIPLVKSIVDYVGRWLESRFMVPKVLS